MKKWLLALLFISLCVVCAGCADKSPKIECTAEYFTTEVNDFSFSLKALNGFVEAKDYSDQLYPFSKIEMEAEVDVTCPGKYPVTLKLEDENGKTEKQVIVEVVDTTAPVIYSVTPVIKCFKNTTFHTDALENLIFAYDNQDGMITDRIVAEGEVNTKKPGEYPVTYTVSDSSGNCTSIEVMVVVTNTRDEFLHFIYERTIDFYWGKYFVTDASGKILNYDDAIYYNFTNAGTSQFERASGLQTNSDGTENGILLERREDGVYLTGEKGNYVNNYASTEFFVIKDNGKLVEYDAEVTYETGEEEPLAVQNEFSMKKVSGKFYVEYFVLPNS